MTLRELLVGLRRSAVTLVVFVLIGAAAAAAYAFTAQKEYTSKTRLLVVAVDDSGTLTQNLNGNQLVHNSIQSYADLITSPTVLEPLGPTLGIAEGSLAGKITTTVPLNTQLIDISVRDPSAERAHQLAAAVATQSITAIEALQSSSGNSQRSPVQLSVVSAADTPSSASSPRPILDIVIGVIVGFGLGLALAGARGRFVAVDAPVYGVPAATRGAPPAPPAPPSPSTSPAPPSPSASPAPPAPPAPSASPAPPSSSAASASPSARRLAPGNRSWLDRSGTGRGGPSSPGPTPAAWSGDRSTPGPPPLPRDDEQATDGRPADDRSDHERPTTVHTDLPDSPAPATREAARGVWRTRWTEPAGVPPADRGTDGPARTDGDGPDQPGAEHDDPHESPHDGPDPEPNLDPYQDRHGDLHLDRHVDQHEGSYDDPIPGWDARPDDVDTSDDAPAVSDPVRDDAHRP